MPDETVTCLRSPRYGRTGPSNAEEIRKSRTDRHRPSRLPAPAAPVRSRPGLWAPGTPAPTDSSSVPSLRGRRGQTMRSFHGTRSVAAYRIPYACDAITMHAWPRLRTFRARRPMRTVPSAVSSGRRACPHLPARMEAAPEDPSRRPISPGLELGVRPEEHRLVDHEEGVRRDVHPFHEEHHIVDVLLGQAVTGSIVMPAGLGALEMQAYAVSYSRSRTA